MDFDYFYNRKVEQFNFLKVPEILGDEKYDIQYELNLEKKTLIWYIDDTLIKTNDLDYENKGENEAQRNMKNKIKMSSFSDLVYVVSKDLSAATGLNIGDDKNYYVCFFRV